MRKARAPKPDGQTDAPPAEPTTEPKAASKDRVFADAVRQVYGMTRRRLPDIEVKAAIDAAWASLDATAQAAYLVAGNNKILPGS